MTLDPRKSLYTFKLLTTRTDEFFSRSGAIALRQLNSVHKKGHKVFLILIIFQRMARIVCNRLNRK